MTADSITVRRPKSPARTRVANGSALVSGVDGRSLWVKRAREVAADLTQDKGDVTAAEALLIRRAATLVIECERLETRFATSQSAPDADDVDLFQRTTSALRRVLDSLGLQRRARTLSTNEAAHAAVARAIARSRTP